MHVSSQADKFYPWKTAGIFFSPSSYYCSYSAAVLFVSLLSKPVFVSFTFPPLTDVTPVFHFILASCSSLINKQMTSVVLVTEIIIFLNVK